jgi:hypothetical protein
MSERPQPYVGVSGLVDYYHTEPSGLKVHEPNQLFVEAAAINSGLFETGRLLAMGVKAIDQCQWGNQPFQRWDTTYGSEWYPVGEEEFANALPLKQKHPQTLRVAQTYMDPRKMYQDPGNFHKFMNDIHWRGRSWINAVQFDSLPWHRDEKLLENIGITRRYFLSQTILQCHEFAMGKLGADGVAKMLGRHAASLDYISFDMSHGQGQDLDPKFLEKYLDAVYSSDQLKNVGFVVAGGLDAKTVQELLPALLEKYPDLSWDAEGKLHRLNNIGTQPLQIDPGVKEYFLSSVRVITN